jgi:hypothetical protein
MPAELTGILGDLAEVGSLELNVDTYMSALSRKPGDLAHRQVVVGWHPWKKRRSSCS